MTTVNQLIRKPRKSKKEKSNVPALEACPQKEEFALVFTQQLLKSQTQL
ncbi:MAG: hypothetical protein CM15mP93_15760 [Thiotrichaceae bacterium]|nr:MAG: hypothetical protein CM15mP93_15760 [Thiotrichaceae bacterium]